MSLFLVPVLGEVGLCGFEYGSHLLLKKTRLETEQNLTARDGLSPDKSGGLNGSTQHLLEVYLQQFQKPKSFASIDSNATPPCIGLMEYTLTVRFSRGSIVGSSDLMVLRRPVDLVGLFGSWPKLPEIPKPVSHKPTCRERALQPCRTRLLEAQQIAARRFAYLPSTSAQWAPKRVLAGCMAKAANRLRQSMIFACAEPASGTTLVRRCRMRPWYRHARPPRPPAVE